MIENQSYHDKKVLIMGLGLHGGGVSSARFFACLGARVIVTDIKTEAELKPSLIKLKKYKNIEYVLKKHNKNDFKKADLIIRNPAVPNDSPFLEISRRHNIPVHTDVSWFLSSIKIQTVPELKPVIIGITGTKGKSTTATLLHYLLTKCGKKAILAGNIRNSPLNYLKTANYIILELSSWQLESLAEHHISPHIAVITNIFKDHLNRYKNFKAYAAAKTLIFKNQQKNDVLFLNKNDRVLLATIKKKKITGTLIWYGNRQKKSKYFIHPDTLQVVLKISEYLCLNKKNVQTAINNFRGLKDRMELIADIKGVRYYNDTCASQPDAVMYAINNLKSETNRKTIVLIAGGEDKMLEYNKLAETIMKYIKTIILFKGSASNKLLKALKRHSYKNTKLKIRALKLHNNITSMKEAVIIASENTQKGDIVLLSPGAASFGLFKHEFDRGKQFKKEIKKLCSKIDANFHV